MRERLYSFMRGRYGVDSLGYFLMWITIGVLFFNLFFRSSFLNLLGTVFIVYTYFRMFSKNYVKRSSENTWYLNHTKNIRRWIEKKKNRIKIRKTHKIYVCPSCKQKVKVPKGKGKIEITCPKCREKFIRRS